VGIGPIVVGVFFFMSIIMIGLGVLGEYIGAIHTIVQNRPLVVEKERINFNQVEGDVTDRYSDTPRTEVRS
jgi:hypothetical protein